MAKEIVRLHGFIEGDGFETACVVSALKVTNPPAHDVAYAQFEIVRTDKPAPEGVYTLTVDGQSMKVRHVSAGWIAA